MSRAWSSKTSVVWGPCPFLQPGLACCLAFFSCETWSVIVPRPCCRVSHSVLFLLPPPHRGHSFILCHFTRTVGGQWHPAFLAMWVRVPFVSLLSLNLLLREMGITDPEARQKDTGIMRPGERRGAHIPASPQLRSKNSCRLQHFHWRLSL